MNNILEKTALAMKAVDSYQMSMNQSVKDSTYTIGQDTLTIDFTRNPYAMHMKGTGSVTGNNQQPVSKPIEFYIQNGMMYSLNGTQWEKIPYNSNNSPTQPAVLENQTKTHLLAPYLSVTSNDNSYILTGTISSREFSTLFPNNQINWTTLKEFKYNLEIYKNTYLYRTVATDVYSQPGIETSVGLTYQNYNNEPAIQIPQDVLSSAK